MRSDSDIRTEATAQGFRTKRNNLIAASLSGLTLLTISIAFVPHNPNSAMGCVGGALAGFLYANGFEYCLHRFVLHAGNGIFSDQHRMHHTTLQSPDAARYVNFSRNPWGVVALFFANSIPFLILQWITRAGWIVGMFPAFALYYVAFEEIHWRSHMGGRLPKWLRPAARHHLLHHARDTERFNVFLPFFDRLVDPIPSTRQRNTEKRRA